MRRLFFVTHADVVIDPDVPVPAWRLSMRGIARHRAFARVCPPLGCVVSSEERKAMDGADSLADAQGLPVRRVAALHENDRSATGYLPHAEFEVMADAFFANPHDSQRGWERAIDAQARVVKTLHGVVAEAPAGDIAVVAHGAIGALLRAHLLDVDIDRSHDQPAGGGGHLMVVALPDWQLLRDWTPIEDYQEVQA